MTQAADTLASEPVRRGPQADPRIVRRRLTLWLVAAVTHDWWTTRWAHILEELGAATADARRLTDPRDRALREAAERIVEAWALSEAELRVSIAEIGVNLRERSRRLAREALADWALVEAETAEGR